MILKSGGPAVVGDALRAGSLAVTPVPIIQWFAGRCCGVPFSPGRRFSDRYARADRGLEGEACLDPLSIPVLSRVYHSMHNGCNMCSICRHEHILRKYLALETALARSSSPRALYHPVFRAGVRMAPPRALKRVLRLWARERRDRDVPGLWPCPVGRLA